MLQNWTYSLFYLLANMWGSVVVSLMFWGFANETTTVDEAKKYYPLFGLGANVALIFSGLFVRYVSGLRRAWAATATTGWSVADSEGVGRVVARAGAAVTATVTMIVTTQVWRPTRRPIATVSSVQAGSET